MDKLYLGDCLDIMPLLVDQGVIFDAVITDIPYGTTSCQWDTVIPFDKMWENLNKLCPDGPIVLFAKQPFTSVLVTSNIAAYREHVVWLKNKAASGFNVSRRHLAVLEDIVVFSQKVGYTFNPQMWEVTEKSFMTQRKTFKDNEFVGNNVYGATTRTRKPDTGKRNPINIVPAKIPHTPSNTKQYSDDVDVRYHPTQKPLELMDYLINTYTNEGATVLDFTMGSGTTGVSATKLGRHFVGIEKEEKYYIVAKERIERVVS